jgi:hypothetical protein
MKSEAAGGELGAKEMDVDRSILIDRDLTQRSVGQGSGSSSQLEHVSSRCVTESLPDRAIIWRQVAAVAVLSRKPIGASP